MRSRGQSLVEFAVAMAGMSLLLLGTVTLARYQQVERHTLLAARELAFTAGWRAARSDARASAAPLHARLFTQADLRDPLRGELLVADDDLQVSRQQAPLQGLAAQSATLMIAPLHAGTGWLGRRFDPGETGLAQGAAQARIAPRSHLPAPFDALDLVLDRGYAIVGDAWHAAGPAQVNDRAGALVPAAAFGGLRQLWGPLSAAVSVVEPSLAEWCPGLIEADRVPEDRLGSGVTPLPRGCP